MDQHWGISNVVGPAQIAKYLLDEIETVGMLSLVDDLTPREAVGVQLGQYTKDRLLPIGTVLFTVEQEVRIGEGRDFPYMYTAGIWPPEEPLVGYTSTRTVPFAAIALSKMSYWQLSGSRSIESSSELWHVLKPSLWSSQHFGFDGTITLILGLLKHGFMLDTEAAARAICMLLAGMSQFEYEVEMIDRFVDGGVPDGDEAWKVCKFNNNHSVRLDDVSDDMKWKALVYLIRHSKAWRRSGTLNLSMSGHPHSM